MPNAKLTRLLDHLKRCAYLAHVIGDKKRQRLFTRIAASLEKAINTETPLTEPNNSRLGLN